MKTTLTAFLAALALTATADNLKGFAYGTQAGPTGREWQSPEELSLNKEQPRAHIFSYATQAEALKVLPEGSAYYQTLDGTWKFQWVPSPEQRDSTFFRTDFDDSRWDDIAVPGCWNVQGLQKDGTMKYGVPIYVNQPVIFYHEVKVDDWRKGVMRTPPAHWTTYKHRNEVGSYRRSFTIPQKWDGRQIYINFDGVDSFFYLWINGRYVGFSKNSRNVARFNITPYLDKKQKVQQVAVEVYRNSDASFLESQDMFRLPGIIRSTYLTSTPDLQIRDLVVRTESIGRGQAMVGVDIEVENLGKKQPKYNVNYQVFPVALYGDETSEPVATLNGAAAKAELSLTNPRLWSAEEPYRYVLVATLTDVKKGTVLDRTSTYFGVRKVEIKDTPASDDEFGLAGRYFYVNGKPVKLKGVNRHENNPSTGHTISREQMTKEVMLMKQGNINHVRLSHYCNDPYFYYLSDKYGLYLEDEANIESHQYYYGAASLSHPKEWEAAHVARNMEMVRNNVNSPSIVIWSLGNEAGPGNNFVSAYKAIKAFDESRPVQYERNNNIVDMGSNQYPSVDWVRHAATGKANVKYPYHISEYAHSMGNAVGNLVDYWEAMESTNFFCGGAIWDWADQAIDTYTPQGVKYFGYGGDHGDTPNDGMFCMNGILFPDLEPKPQYYEVKKVYQNVGVKMLDAQKGQIEVFNKAYFTTLGQYNLVWKLFKDGKQVEQGTLAQNLDEVGPRTKATYTLPYNYAALEPRSEYFVEVEFQQNAELPWAKKGYVQMNEQLAVKAPAQWAAIADVAKGQKLATTEADGKLTVRGEGFHVVLDHTTGAIHELTYGHLPVVQLGNGPQLDALRAPVDNDNWCYGQWYENGLHNLRHKASNKQVETNKDGSVSVSYTIVSQGQYKGRIQGGSSGRYTILQGAEMGANDFHFTTSQVYTIYPDGSIELRASIGSSDPALNLPRLGYALKAPKELDQYTYYGRGPINNYNDRKTGAFVAQYTSKVKDQFVNFPKPQSMGNREDVRWCTLTNSQGQGVQFVSTMPSMSTSALPWSALQMTFSPHPHELPLSDGTYLHLDVKVNGLGGNSCGQGGPLEHDRVKGAVHQAGFIIRPVAASADLAQQAQVTSSTDMPLSVSRDRTGRVTINAQEGSTVLYTLGKGKPQTYNEPIELRGGGTLTAWYQKSPARKTTLTYTKIDQIPVEVIFASSEEVGDGTTGSKLVDGNSSTIWHTMYSVTVASYPHWVDFDCGEMKTIKGFTYLPRQDGGNNGDIKGYKVEVSTDGKTWSQPVAQGEFDNSKKEKKVLLAHPQKARYLRFSALSSQNGQDFASGAEFGVLAE